jgi:hypothetical protein
MRDRDVSVSLRHTDRFEHTAEFIQHFEDGDRELTRK